MTLGAILRTGMQKHIRKIQIIVSGVLTLLLLVTNSSAVFAAQSHSANYAVNEVFFGAGGDLNDCSTNYCAKTTVGESTIGDTKSATYQAQGGFNTFRTPSLTFIVNGGSTNLGYLSTGSATMTTATFSVKSYLSSGYIVQVYGGQPTDTLPGHHPLANLSSPTTSSAGTEQFGMNLTANTSPSTIGAAPIQVPGTTFSFGQVSSNYGQTNKYTFNNGDTIAYSNSSSGETDYTISYLFNISPVTPDGQYVLNQTLVATGTF